MSWTRAIRLALWCTRADLFERQMRRATFSVAATVFCVAAFLILSFGFTLGYGSARRARLQASPQSLCLLVGNPVVADEIPRAKVPELQARLQDKFPTARPRVFGYYIVVEFWTPEPPRSTTSSLLLTGRSIAVDDPLWTKLIVPGASDEGDSAAELGLVVTREMLTRLGVAENRHPATIGLRAKDGRTVPVPVLRVTSEDFLEGFEFLVCEPYLATLDRHKHPPRALSVRTGEMLEGFCDPVFVAAFSRRFGDQLTELGLTREVMLTDDGLAWKLQLATGKPARYMKDWESLKGKLTEMFESLGKDPPHALNDLQAESVEETPTAQFGAYDDLVVYVAQIEDLRPVMNDIVRVMEGMPVSEDKVQQAEEINLQTQTVIASLSAVSVVIVALALLSIYSTLALRAEQMIAPLGMLRAIGMSDGLLSLIQVVEGLSLWIMAAVPGVLCALAAGHFIAARVCDHYVDAYRLWFSAPAIVQLPVLAMCCVMCIGGSWGSHWRTRNRSIMQCLSLDL